MCLSFAARRSWFKSFSFITAWASSARRCRGLDCGRFFASRIRAPWLRSRSTRRPTRAKSSGAAFWPCRRGQVEAARAHGMSRFLLLRRIVLPIALRQAMPAYGNEIILMIKATSLASTITLMEVTGIAHKLISESYRAVEIFLCAGAIYLVLNFAVTRAVQGLEHRLSPHLRDTPAAGRRF